MRGVEVCTRLGAGHVFSLQQSAPGDVWHPPAPPEGSQGTLPPCVTFRLAVVSLQGPGQSPVLPFACCVGSLLSVGRCGRCSCWCRFRIRGAPLLAQALPKTQKTTVSLGSGACAGGGGGGTNSSAIASPCHRRARKSTRPPLRPASHRRRCLLVADSTGAPVHLPRAITPRQTPAAAGLREAARARSGIKATASACAGSAGLGVCRGNGAEGAPRGLDRPQQLHPAPWPHFHWIRHPPNRGQNAGTRF